MRTALLRLFGHRSVFRYSVSEPHKADTSVFAVFIVTPSSFNSVFLSFFVVTPAFFNSVFLSFKNPKHESLASSWRNLDDLRTQTKKLMPLQLIMPSSMWIAWHNKNILLQRWLMKKSSTMLCVMPRMTMGNDVRMNMVDTITSILARAICRSVLAFCLTQI